MLFKFSYTRENDRIEHHFTKQDFQSVHIGLFSLAATDFIENRLLSEKQRKHTSLAYQCVAHETTMAGIGGDYTRYFQLRNEKAIDRQSLTYSWINNNVQLNGFGFASVLQPNESVVSKNKSKSATKRVQ